MLSLASQIEAAASSPPIDAGERRALYDAAKKLLNVTEDPFDTIYRVNNSVSQIYQYGASLSSGAQLTCSSAAHDPYFLSYCL